MVSDRRQLCLPHLSLQPHIKHRSLGFPGHQSQLLSLPAVTFKIQHVLQDPISPSPWRDFSRLCMGFKRRKLVQSFFWFVLSYVQPHISSGLGFTSCYLPQWPRPILCAMHVQLPSCFHSRFYVTFHTKPLYALSSLHCK